MSRGACRVQKRVSSPPHALPKLSCSSRYLWAAQHRCWELNTGPCKSSKCLWHWVTSLQSVPSSCQVTNNCCIANSSVQILSLSYTVRHTHSPEILSPIASRLLFFHFLLFLSSFNRSPFSFLCVMETSWLSLQTLCTQILGGLYLPHNFMISRFRELSSNFWNSIHGLNFRFISRCLLFISFAI